MDEHPEMQRAAYEAKYSANQLEKLYNHLYMMTMSLNDMTCGLVECLKKKGMITTEELDQGMTEYVEQRKKQEIEVRIEQLGFKDKDEVVSPNDSLVFVKLGILFNDTFLPTYPKDLFFVTGRTYIYPGLEEQLVGLKIGDKKKFELTMPEDFKIETVKGKTLQFHVLVHDIRKKMTDEQKSDQSNTEE